MNKEENWSLNLGDSYYETHVEELFLESVDTIQQTKGGYSIYLVTPAACGDLRIGLIPQLIVFLQQANLSVREIRYIDQCGCGGFVTRVYR